MIKRLKEFIMEMIYGEVRKEFSFKTIAVSDSNKKMVITTEKVYSKKTGRLVSGKTTYNNFTEY